MRFTDILREEFNLEYEERGGNILESVEDILMEASRDTKLHKAVTSKYIRSVEDGMKLVLDDVMSNYSGKLDTIVKLANKNKYSYDDLEMMLYHEVVKKAGEDYLEAANIVKKKLSTEMNSNKSLFSHALHGREKNFKDYFDKFGMAYYNYVLLRGVILYKAKDLIKALIGRLKKEKGLEE